MNTVDTPTTHRLANELAAAFNASADDPVAILNNVLDRLDLAVVVGRENTGRAHLPAFTADALFERVGRLVNDHDWLTANILIGLIHDIAPLPEVAAYRALIGYLEALDGVDFGDARVKQTAWDMESGIRVRVFKLLAGPA